MKLEICDVSKQYKDKCAVDHANLTLTPGVWDSLELTVQARRRLCG